MEDEKLPRRQREKLRQRRQMLAAALDLFSEKGYHNVSMHEIAERGEFAIGTLYKFFQNKEDLYRALVLQYSDMFHQALTRAIAAAPDDVERLRSYVRAKGELVRDNLSFIRLYLAESRGASYNIKAGLADEVRRQYYDFLQGLALVFKSGIRARRFRNIDDPYRLAVAVDSTVNAFLLLWLDAPETHPYPEDPDAILNIFFKGLLVP